MEPRVGASTKSFSMARPKQSDVINLSERINFTVGAIERLACPSGKQQAFMRDSSAPGLHMRVTSEPVGSLLLTTQERLMS